MFPPDNPNTRQAWVALSDRDDIYMPSHWILVGRENTPDWHVRCSQDDVIGALIAQMTSVSVADDIVRESAPSKLGFGMWRLVWPLGFRTNRVGTCARVLVSARMHLLCLDVECITAPASPRRDAIIIYFAISAARRVFLAARLCRWLKKRIRNRERALGHFLAEIVFHLDGQPIAAISSIRRRHWQRRGALHLNSEWPARFWQMRAATSINVDRVPMNPSPAIV